MTTMLMWKKLQWKSITCQEAQAILAYLTSLTLGLTESQLAHSLLSNSNPMIPDSKRQPTKTRAMYFHQARRKILGIQERGMSSIKTIRTFNSENQPQDKIWGRDTSNPLRATKTTLKAISSNRKKNLKSCGHPDKTKTHQIFTQWRKLSTRQSRPLPGAPKTKWLTLTTA